MSAHAIGIAAGSVVDRLLGDPQRGHPVAGFGRVARELERVAWRPRRGAGALYTLALVAVPAATAAAFDRSLIRRPARRAAYVAAVTWTVLGSRSLGRAANRLAHAAQQNDLDEARAVAPVLVGRDPAGLDVSELCRAAVESVAENTADAVVGPLVWGVLAGPAGMVAYRAANTLDAMIGHRDARYERFGWAAAKLDDVLTWPAARLATLLAVALAPIVGGDPRRAWRTLVLDGKAHPSPNAGRLEAVFAGALRVRLGGANRYGDLVEERPHLGDGALPDPETVARAVRLSESIGAAAAVLCALAAWRFRR